MKFTEAIDRVSWTILLLIGVYIILVFSLLFYFLSIYFPENGLSTQLNTTYFSSIYFSVIVFTSLGYGDILPLGLSRLLSTVEVMMGLLFFGIFIAKIISERNNRMINKIYEFEYLNFLKSHKKRLGENRQTLLNIADKIKKNPTDPNIEREIKYHFMNHRQGVLRHIGSTIRTIYNFLDKEKKKKEYFIEEVDVSHMQGIVHGVLITVRSIDKAFKELNDAKIRWKSGATRNLMNFVYSSANNLIIWLNKNYHDKEIKDKSDEIKETFSQIKRTHFV